MEKIKIKKKTLLFYYLLMILTAIIIILGAITYLIGQALSTYFILGTIGVILIVLFISYFYLYSQKKEIILTRNKLLLLFFIFHICYITTITLLIGENIYILPICIASMLIALLLDIEIAFIVNWILTILASILNMTFASTISIFYLISGTFAILLINRAKQRRNIIWVAISVIIVNACITIFINVILYNQVITNDVLFAIFNGVFSVIITLGSLPLWEALFDVVTPFKLLELSNSDQKLIQRLLIEAPGTFHHSQLVANLAETATTDIGANYLLARVGALYHDIGKLKNPELFQENQNGYNPHDELEPEESAKIILDHVKYGFQLANEYHLPKNVKDIIKQHQGATVIKFFYYKAKEKNLFKDIDIKEFTYPGPIPQSIEAAVVMLADSTEAAVRSIPQNEKTMEKIEEMIKKVMKTKLEENQLIDCDLKIKELEIIKDSFLKVYKGLYHDRGAYPK